MNSSRRTSSRLHTRLMAAVASLAIAGAIGVGAVTTGTAPVLADAVKVEAPQVPSFADVVEKVSPAVVSVRVKADVTAASDRGRGMFSFGPDDLPNDPNLRRFFRQFPGFGNQDRARPPRNRETAIPRSAQERGENRLSARLARWSCDPVTPAPMAAQLRLGCPVSHHP